MKFERIFLLLCFAILTMALASALVVKNVNYDLFTPGSQGDISITLENELNEDITDVSFSLITERSPFSVIGSSEDSVNKIKDDDEESFNFVLKAANTAKPGDYELGYSAFYREGNASKTKNGKIGITISGNPSLEYSATIEKPVFGEQTKLNIRITNKGFADAKFVSVKIIPQGYLLLSDDDAYIGNVDSDDFETAAFDVYLNSLNPIVRGNVEYTDFNNKKVNNDITLPVKIYSREEATNLGIIQKSNAPVYIVILILLIAAWIIWRWIKKRRARKKANIMKG